MAIAKKQQRFIVEFCKNPSAGAAQAARLAGYKASRAKITAHELMKNAEIKREIDRRIAQIEKRAALSSKTLDFDSWTDELLAIMELCRTAGAGAWQVAGMTKCMELIGKSRGFLAERVQLGVDDALIEKLMEGRRRAGLLTDAKALDRPQLPATVIEGETGRVLSEHKPPENVSEPVIEETNAKVSQ